MQWNDAQFAHGDLGGFDQQSLVFFPIHAAQGFFQVVIDNIPALWEGMQLTFLLTFLAICGGILGGTIAADGRVMLILDMGPLIRRGLEMPLQPVETAPPPAATAAASPRRSKSACTSSIPIGSPSTYRASPTP